MKTTLRQLFKFFSSLKLAVICILLLATVLAIATIEESNYGMRAVHLMIYGTPWFAGVLALLALNVFCAAMSRYPWKKHQTGFVVTHSGILILLFGSFLTQKFGVDANLPVGEGTRSNRVILNDVAITVEDEVSGKTQEFPVPEFAKATKGKLVSIELAPGKMLEVDEYLPRVIVPRGMMKSPVEGMGNPAVSLRLFNDRFEVNEWLTLNHPSKPGELNLGPAVVTFQKLWNEKDEAVFLKPAANVIEKKSIGYLLATYGGKEFRIPIEAAMKRWYSLPGTPLQLTIDRYLPFAVVDKNELISRSDEPMNPAVQLNLRKEGATEKHTVFANFPEFSTLHKAKEVKNPIGMKFRMVATTDRPSGMKQGRLLLAQSADDKRLFYRTLSKEGIVNFQGEVTPGKPMPTGWMDLEFEIAEWIPFAVEKTDPRYIEYISGGDNYLSALHVREVGVKNPTDFWLYEGTGRTISTGGHDLTVQFRKRTFSLPFQIYLEKFTMGTDPGTTKAATYESRVKVLENSKESEPQVISMNEPLYYGGYTLYQASYQMEEGRPPTSIFAVNYDPGRWVKYIGSLLICLGASLMFWMNPHYWSILLGRKGEK